MSSFSPDWLAKERDRLLADDVEPHDHKVLEDRSADITAFLTDDLPSSSHSYFDRSLLAAKRALVDEQLALLDHESTPRRVQSRREELDRRWDAWREYEAEKRARRERLGGGRGWEQRPRVDSAGSTRSTERLKVAPKRGEVVVTPQRRASRGEAEEERVEALREALGEVNCELHALDPEGVLTPIWKEMQDFGHDHSPEDNLFHHLQLSQAELEAYRTGYGGTWWRLARESTDATRGWCRARRVEWERLRDRRGELERQLRELTRPPPPPSAPARHPSRRPHLPTLAPVTEQSRAASPAATSAGPVSPYTVQSAGASAMARSPWRMSSVRGLLLRARRATR